jgi:hypothetical protein
MQFIEPLNKFFITHSDHGLPSGKPFPPSTPQPYQIIGNNVWRVVARFILTVWYNCPHESTSSSSVLQSAYHMAVLPTEILSEQGGYGS